MKIDIGCGTKKFGEDWIGVDQYAMPGVDHVLDFGSERLPFDDASVDEIYCSHVLEHLTNFEGKWQRTHLFNEVYRVLRSGARATFTFPHWCSNRYYGDPTHREPFSEMGFCYLSKAWRLQYAPHTDKAWFQHGYDCDFSASLVFTLRHDLAQADGDTQQNALKNFKEACEDITATLIKI